MDPVNSCIFLLGLTSKKRQDLDCFLLEPFFMVVFVVSNLEELHNS